MSSGGFNPYTVLNVEYDVDEGVLRGVYKRLCLKYHPDKNIGNEEAAETEFKKIVKAYNILSDATSKRKYDQTGDVGSENEVDADRFADNRFSCFDGVFRAGGAGGAGNARDEGDGFMFHTVSGNPPPVHRSPQNPTHFVFESPNTPSGHSDYTHPHHQHRVLSDNQHTIQLQLKDLYTGCTKTIVVNNTVVCPTCRGDGQLHMRNTGCRMCYGGDPQCPNCKGSFESFFAGQIGQAPVACKTCSGKGVTKSKLKQRIKIPAGLDDFYTAKIPAKHGPPILIQCVSRLPPGISRRGLDICFTITASFCEIVCGLKRVLKLPDGDPCPVTLPGVVKEGCHWKVNRRGLRDGTAGTTTPTGDLILNVVIEWPKRAVNSAEWAQLGTRHAVSPTLKKHGVHKLSSGQLKLWNHVVSSFVS